METTRPFAQHTWNLGYIRKCQSAGESDNDTALRLLLERVWVKSYIRPEFTFDEGKATLTVSLYRIGDMIG